MNKEWCMSYHLLGTDFAGSATDCNFVRWDETNLATHLWKRRKCHSSSLPFSQLYLLAGIHWTILQADSRVVQKKTKSHRIAVYQINEFNHFSKSNPASSKPMVKWKYKKRRKRRKEFLLFLAQARCENWVKHLVQSHPQTSAHEPKFLPKLISILKDNRGNYLCQKCRWIKKPFR